MKTLIAVFVALLLLPASALAVPSDLRLNEHVRSGSMAVPPDAAPQRQAPVQHRTVTVPASSDGFDWGDAGIGAACAFGLLAVSAGAGVTIRRRQAHRAPVAIG